MLGTVKWRGDRGKVDDPIAKSRFNDIVGLAELQAFAGWIKANLTDCNIVYYGVSDKTRMDEPRPGVDANVDDLAILVVQENTTGKVRRHSIPAPKAAIIDETQQQGDRVIYSIVNDFATAYSGATGLSFSALYGYIVKKK